MSIRSNIEDIMAAIPNTPGLGSSIRAKAMAAIAAGQGSTQWTTYMEVFSQSPEELARLEPTDGSGNDPAKNVARTYLVANGMCGSDTTGTRTIETVGNTLNLP